MRIANIHVNSSLTQVLLWVAKGRGESKGRRVRLSVTQIGLLVAVAGEFHRFIATYQGISNQSRLALLIRATGTLDSTTFFWVRS